ncbi:hypothetical protein [Streptomyces sp. H27-D2]|uniref:hypothetical protein n=1 Tax=Streptomyces sp. H27-D2 TaxID=3046304 RepID=UPI002DBBDF5E|nr:hypothetical protein [Streptomyces sp. H27-D2]MEC4016606.1 hypothetical protein [Streptomyces sp. H27-D2]
MTTGPRRTHHDDGTRTTTAPAATAGRAGTAKIKEALDARDALATALTRAGIQLPAMDVRTPWADAVQDHNPAATRGERREVDRAGEIRYALVHLGVCSAPVAHELATVIMKGAAR